MNGVRLEDFDAGRPEPPEVSEAAPAPDPAVLETARVAGYEDGYKSGWDDAIRSAEQEAKTVGAELARNLRDLSFTYFEAREEVLAALEPFLHELLGTIFPELLPEAAAAALAKELAELATEGSESGVRILVSPDDAEVVKGLLEPEADVTARVLEEPAMLPGQARIASELREVAIDTGSVLERLRAALGAEVQASEAEAADDG